MSSKKKKPEGSQFPDDPYNHDDYFKSLNFIVGLGLFIRGEEGESYPILEKMALSIFGNRNQDTSLFTEDLAENLAVSACQYLIDAVNTKRGLHVDNSDDGIVGDSEVPPVVNVDDDIEGGNFPHLPI